MKPSEAVNWYYDMTPDEAPQRIADGNGPQLVALCNNCKSAAAARGADLLWAADGSETSDLECYLCDQSNNPTQGVSTT